MDNGTLFNMDDMGEAAVVAMIQLIKAARRPG